MFSVSQLDDVVQREPARIVIYAVNGCGKSSLCAPTPWGQGAERPIYMNINNGLSTLRVAGKNHLVKTYQDAAAFLRSVLVDDHDFKTLVIDTADDLERLIFAEVARINKVDNISSIGWGQGYDQALDKWKAFQDTLDMIRKRRQMDIVVLAQCEIKKFSDPMGGSYDMYTPKLHGATNKGDSTASLFKGWADAVLLMKREMLTAKDPTLPVNKKAPEKRKVVGVDSVVLYTNPTGAFDAKNRYNLPDVIDASHDGWRNLMQHIDAFWESQGVNTPALYPETVATALSEELPID